MEPVKDLIRMGSSDILLLQETKIDKVTLLSLSKKSWNKNVGMPMSARGSTCGIATLWIENLFSLSNSHIS